MKYKIGDLAEIIDGDRGKNYPQQHEFFNDGYCLFLDAGNVTADGFKFDSTHYITQEKDSALNNGRLNRGDLIYTTRGTVGNAAYYDDNVPYAVVRINSGMVILRCNRELVEERYLYQILKSSFYRPYFKSFCTGSAQPQLPIKNFSKIELDIPDIDTQRRIADILSSYDDLIENNRKQIKLLEEAAQRLYKEWFVDLRFPGWETAEIVDGVPVGWTAHSLGQLCALRKMTLKPEEIPSGLPYIGLEHMPRKDICLSDWGDSGAVNSNKYVYQKNDILFGKIRPYFHKVGFALNDGITSTDTIVVQPQAEVWGLVLMVMSSTHFVDYTYQNCKEGSKMPRADWNQMEKYKVLLPDYTVICLFERYISNMTHRIKTLAMQNRNLMEARDRLLPKLMSGELEV